MKPIDFESLIIFENQHYIAVNKPPYLSTLDERQADAAPALLRLAKKYEPDAQVCHRLDKETSGVLMIARNPDAYRHLSMQFEHRQVKKIYHAVACGLHQLEGIRVYLPILPLKTGTVRIDTKEGKEAETIFNTLEIFKQHTLIECMPVTGRMHQIRIHLACLKASIVQDLAYGGSPIYLSEIKKKFNLKQTQEPLPLISRVALHAQAITFCLTEQPESSIEIQAPYPKDIAALLNQLRKNVR